MQRNSLEQLRQWKASKTRKPLIIKGARQVGKTWLMREFGRMEYRHSVYFNFDEEEALHSIFESTKTPARIIELLSLVSGQRIDAGDTLIIFDEVQECPAALNALKYFKEQAPDYHIVAAGSLLGTLLAQPKSYPVGMVNILNLAPLDFGEYLNATAPTLHQYYESITIGQRIEEIFHQQLLDAYHHYLIIGGMPECVSLWTEERDPQKILQTQNELIQLYENDFSKHNGKINSGRILLVFRSIVSQLAKENGKFMYGAVKAGARAREFEEAIEWLVSAGMLHRTHCSSQIAHPLPAYDRLDCFKLYLFDTGLLKCMAGIDNAAILLKSDYQFKGALAENYVLQQLQGQFEVAPRYYSDKKRELDFLLQKGQEIIPVEVKGGSDRHAASFKSYIASAHPAAAIRFSERGYVKDGEITNIPLYLAAKTYALL